MEMDVQYDIPEGANEHIKDTIEKTVGYIKQNGISFEKKLKLDEKFSFINPGDKYYEYYRILLKDRMGEEIMSKGVENSGPDADEGDAKTIQNIKKTPKEPYQFVFSSYDKNVTSKGLDIIKLTAQFIVANEDLNYMAILKEHYSTDSQFDFLNSGHPLNDIFIDFVNQYKQVINNTSIQLKTKDNIDINEEILRRCFERAEYDEYLKELGNEATRIKILQSIQFAAFEWTNFKLIGKISFEEDHEVSASYGNPLDFGRLRLKNISQDDEESTDIFSKPDLVNISKTDDVMEIKKSKRKIKVKAAGETRLKRQKQTRDLQNTKNTNKKVIECPITKQLIAEDKFDRHLQILLSDPRYNEEKLKYKAKHKLTNLTNDEAYENIKRLVRGTK